VRPVKYREDHESLNRLVIIIMAEVRQDIYPVKVAEPWDV
jgi:hypothetical protein